MNSFNIFYTTAFKKDLKKFKNKSIDFELIRNCVQRLAEGGYEKIPEIMKPHLLKGNYANYWECHIKPDLLLIWRQNDEYHKIELARIGNHSDLFG